MDRVIRADLGVFPDTFAVEEDCHCARENEVSLLEVGMDRMAFGVPAGRVFLNEQSEGFGSYRSF